MTEILKSISLMSFSPWKHPPRGFPQQISFLSKTFLSCLFKHVSSFIHLCLYPTLPHSKWLSSLINIFGQIHFFKKSFVFVLSIWTYVSVFHLNLFHSFTMYEYIMYTFAHTTSLMQTLISLTLSFCHPTCPSQVTHSSEL